MPSRPDPPPSAADAEDTTDPAPGAQDPSDRDGAAARSASPAQAAPGSGDEAPGSGDEAAGSGDEAPGSGDEAAAPAVGGLARPRFVEAVVLDPEPFLEYLDPRRREVVVCFALGTGVGEPQLAALGRQLAETFAELLLLHDAFITLPQMLRVERDGGAERAGSGAHLSAPAFAVFHSLPGRRMVRQVTRGLGARVALTGRLIGEGREHLLGINLFDVERQVLLACAEREGPREELPRLVVEAGVRLLGRFIEIPEPTLRARAEEALGTGSYAALYNWAQARDLERQSAAGQRVDRQRLIDRLILALQADARYVAPLERLLVAFEAARAARDERALDRIARGLAKVALARPAIGMLRAEALEQLGARSEALAALRQTLEKHQTAAQVHYMLGLLEEQARPRVAQQHFELAATLDPTRALYRDKLQGRSA